MGMFDTVYFDKARTCPLCQGKIYSVQTKAFENMLEDFHVKDCIGHAEEIMILKEELFCDSCSKFTGKSIYIVVGRGILLGITDTLEEAKKLLNDLNQEKLLLWYHDLYQRYIGERKEKHSYGRFLEDLREWYGERLYERPETDAFERIRFILNSSHLEGALNPVESIERFMTYNMMRKALQELQEEGREILDIYYAEEMSPGEESWSVDVYQDELNERCHLNWTWTVISKKQLEQDGEKEEELPEWDVVVEEPFSDEVVCKAIEKWLRGRGYEFGVRMIALEQARGSGLIKELKERKVESEESEAVPLESLEREMEAEENKRIAEFIAARGDKRKVFYYAGFYGSLVADVESDRLLGKIEGIDEYIVYEGNTVRERERRFREAVSRYKKE
ncbi:MAG TPA: hypothetical protein VMW40_06265 [Candidatus Bathyarchaeia archaeon]|nr:hypothetical protein [Candidatus Bathyarchaeia archaeon]